MAENKTFTLIGKFDDQITKKLKDLNKEFQKLSKPLSKDNAAASLRDGFKAANSELKTLHDEMKTLNKLKFKFDKSGIQAAREEVQMLGKDLESVSKKGLPIDKSGLKAAQEDAKILGKILEANALIKVGEGFANALTAGASSAVNILQQGLGFVGKRYSEAVQDQLGDVMARGSLFGSLNKEGMFKEGLAGKEGQALKDASNDMYLQTKNISRSMDSAINEIIRTSTVSSKTIQILSRQLGDNLLPVMLKEKGITDLSIVSREKLNEVMGGENGVGKKLAILYSQIGSVITSPAYAPQAAMGVTQFLGSGTINRQLSVFENNPILVSSLKEGLKKFGNTVEGRIKAASYGFSIAMPEAALEEAKNTIAGGMQSVNDTFLGPSGILTLTADIGKQGEKTLAMMTSSGARDKQIAKYDRRNKEVLEALAKQGRKEAEIQKIEEQQKNNRVRFIKNLDDFYKSADSPIEVIATQFGPLLQSFANMMNSAGNLLIGPVNSIIGALARPLTELQDNFENLGSDIASGKKSLAEALGRGLAETFKALASYFNPEQAGKDVGTGIQKFLSDFMKGFKGGEVDGERYMKIVLDTFKDIILKMLFNNGNALQGVTPLGDALGKVFLLLAAPAFISAVIAGVVPLAIMGFGNMLMGVFAGLAGGALAGVAGFALPIVALVAGFVIFEGPLRMLADWLKDTGAKLSESTNWVASAAGLFLGGLGDILRGLTNFFTGIWDLLVGIFTGNQQLIVQGVKKIFSGIIETLIGAAESVVGLGGIIIGAVGNLFTAIGRKINDIAISVGGWISDRVPGSSKASPRPAAGASSARAPKAKASAFGSANPFSGSLSQAIDFEMANKPANSSLVIANSSETIIPSAGKTPEREPKAKAAAFGSANPFSGSLGQAISFEMANKPSNSSLVIANSSETVIPAAGGLGVGSFMETLKEGFGQLTTTMNENNQVYTENGKRFTEGLFKVSGQVIESQTQINSLGSALSKAQEHNNNMFSKVQEQLNSNQNQTASMFSAIGKQISQIASSAGGMFGGALGMMSGSLGAASSLAQNLGLTITSTTGGKHAPGSYHYAGRAIDVAGSPGAMLAYAQRLASTSGGRMAELYYTPLGFSIKNGVKVPWTIPNHMDHVHVAYALGKGTPAFFSNQKEAESWERKMMPPSAKVTSITSNTSEGFGSSTIHAPITIYQQPNQDPEELASLVAMRIGMVVDELRNH
jgi:hypothetical protein